MTGRAGDRVLVPSTDGTTLHGLSWPARQAARAIVVIGHGLGEHAGLYAHVAEALRQSGDLAILAFDFRGHGESPGKRGYVRDVTQLVNDWGAALELAHGTIPHQPLFALGHSYGGLSALMAATANRLPCAGLIVSNPSLRLRMPVPLLKLAAGRVLRRLAPRVTLNASLPVQFLTRDPEMQRRRREDQLSHNRISAPLFFGMREGAETVLSNPDRIKIPILMVLGEADPVIDPETSRAWLEQCTSSDKTLKVYPDRMHEPLADLGRDEVLRDITGWILARLV